jgi:hypothetical protein
MKGCTLKLLGGKAPKAALLLSGRVAMGANVLVGGGAVGVVISCAATESPPAAAPSSLMRVRWAVFERGRLVIGATTAHPKLQVSTPQLCRWLLANKMATNAWAPSKPCSLTLVGDVQIVAVLMAPQDIQASQDSKPTPEAREVFGTSAARWPLCHVSSASC